jgi:NADH:ubiquinone oxidoreductase subunit 5 (subunit L)/multisubunit Na+/H+ antiporter MnhA subunit
VAIVSIGVLALVGGLALAVFTKTVGIVFLGRARSRAAEKAEEATRAMITAQLLPALLCIMLGVFSPAAIQYLETISSAANSVAPVNLNWSLLMVAVFILVFASVIYILSFGTRESPRRYLTWECGFGPLTPRMQTTSESFSQPIERIVTPILQYKLHEQIEGTDRRHFPEKITAEIEIGSILETRVYSPVVLAVRNLSAHLGKLQAGSIHLYLLYMLATLIVLLLAGVAS